MKDFGWTAQNKSDGSLYLKRCGLHREKWRVEKWISELPEWGSELTQKAVRPVRCEVIPLKKRKR